MSRDLCCEGTAAFPGLSFTDQALPWSLSLPFPHPKWSLSYSCSRISSFSLFQAQLPSPRPFTILRLLRALSVLQINPTRSSSPDPSPYFCLRLPCIHSVGFACVCPALRIWMQIFCDWITINLGTFHIGAHPVLNRSLTVWESLLNYLMGTGFSSSFVSQLLGYKNNQTTPLGKQLQKFQKSKKNPNFHHWSRAVNTPRYPGRAPGKEEEGIWWDDYGKVLIPLD